MWKKYITRRLAVQVAQAWNYGWGEAMKKVYGISLTDTLVFRDDTKTEYYVETKQHEKYVAGLYSLLENVTFIKNFHQDAQAKLENILQITIDEFSIDLDKLSNKKLFHIYKDFVLPNVEQFYIRMWTVFNIGEPLSDVVKSKLIKSVVNKEKISDYLLNLSSPLFPNDIINERIDILKISLKLKKLNKNETISLLQKHTEKYKHIPMFDFDHAPHTIKYFQKELSEITNPKKELEELKKSFKQRGSDFKAIVNKIKPDKEFNSLLVFLKENVFLRDYRDMIRQKLNVELRKFYSVLAMRLNITVEQIATLSNEEIQKSLKDNNFFSKKTVAEREKNYLLIQKTNKVQIYSGKKAVEKFNQEVGNINYNNVNEISGYVGSKGVVKGVVKVIYTNKDLKKVKNGDVLVTTMTRQDFISAIRKASALVTDEGGVTCHAAIIARELNKPCIVATKNGTKILKDGDWVEVDAFKGIVKKII
ncbi:MAG: hypothetical protein A2821_03550 [Candidatus Magasanikbacteria bacterium RIFCSPHIGHO2_01_FULL_41_23]|uniref:PEP-utilising enzyme mobile domain-containing protein n=1 Tax=Candidatus Magasanikbacteria bacterium RIFCSPLOWO2_01_FULL_40_15 TaxID=1798686 RepID=A0A1F6N1I4_9BACT|nr:MAG: hypothetical protein A2821_03550 [Candidatus Magasanikbacteria bacterium RIFCSPHIGHO2_01_FULL_41_23]OGH66625.1 MAG: hypothetical protein A3C66_03130 [Candidatus Magasanikbacteria bacterium RIFCSPHIGHO2_02_FULL_41_35]OGH74778.1 MAG: hypothetical protein A3F22_00915 [Candidatus Magasanikbacteria bacterium RIFCSPHIGHO2_12_FULL_41_16]OGH77754.1 MAG: hypothetical protein A2983_03890 [Candidatus Magasanikbacteria bacterium RIFCSPLOWO2_01_FULL_40_15]